MYGNLSDSYHQRAIVERLGQLGVDFKTLRFLFHSKIVVYYYSLSVCYQIASKKLFVAWYLCISVGYVRVNLPYLFDEFRRSETQINWLTFIPDKLAHIYPSQQGTIQQGEITGSGNILSHKNESKSYVIFVKFNNSTNNGKVNQQPKITRCIYME